MDVLAFIRTYYSQSVSQNFIIYIHLYIWDSKIFDLFHVFLLFPSLVKLFCLGAIKGINIFSELLCHTHRPRLNPETAWRCNRDTWLCCTWHSPFKKWLLSPFHLPPSAARHRNAAQMFQPSNCWSICVINPVRCDEGTGGWMDRRARDFKGQEERKREKGSEECYRFPVA